MYCLVDVQFISLCPSYTNNTRYNICYINRSVTRRRNERVFKRLFFETTQLDGEHFRFASPLLARLTICVRARNNNFQKNSNMTRRNNERLSSQILEIILLQIT